MEVLVCTSSRRKRNSGSLILSSSFIVCLSLFSGILLHLAESLCPKELPFSCADRSLCVSLDRLCDGAGDCQDGSDERGFCNTTCAGSKCQQACRKTPAGPRCYCHQGFYLASDRKSCQDIDECLLWPPVCSQLCNNTAPGYQCACAEGYEMRQSGRSCSAKDRVIAYIVYIHQSSLMRLELGLPGYSYPKLLVRSKGHILALALDTAEERVYYYDAAEMAIRRVDINGENVQDVITNGLMSVSALALDWMGRNLYVADDQRRAVYACSLKTAMCVDLRLPQINVPRSLVVDSSRRKLYWGDCGRNHRISSATLDGREPHPVVEKDVLCATSLFVDLPTDTLYGADISLQRIEALQLSGARIRHTMSEVEQPMSVAVFEEALYWTSLSARRRSHDQRRGIILTASKYTASKPMSLGLELPELPYSMQLYHPTLQLREERNDCDHEHCSDICLLTEGGYVCACPAGTKLGADGHACIERFDEASLVIVHKNYLLRILPDGVGAKTFDHLTFLASERNVTALAYDSVEKRVYVASGVVNDSGVLTSTISYFYLNDGSTWHTIYADNIGHVTSLSVDWISRNLYWVDKTKRVIAVARLDGSSKIVLLQAQQNINFFQKPVAVAVDPIGRKLYYSDCGQRPHIGICGLTGHTCTQPVHGDTRDCVTDLKIDQMHRRLYWTNQLRGSVAASNLEATEIQLIIPSPRPVGVALTSKNIYYTDSERQFSGLMYKSKDNQEMKYSILTGISPLGAIVSTEADLQPIRENICSVGNGGCSDVCLANSEVEAVCLCPETRHLAGDGKTCLPQAFRQSMLAADIDTTTSEPSIILPDHLPRRAASLELSVGAASSAGSLYGAPIASLIFSCLHNNGCLNGGTCVVIKDDHSKCRCRENYTGSLCESLLTISTTTTLALSTALYTTQSLSTSAVVALSVCLTALLCGAVAGSFCAYRYFCGGFSNPLESWLNCSTSLKAGHVEPKSGDESGRQTVLYVPSSPHLLAYDNPGHVDPDIVNYSDHLEISSDISDEIDRTLHINDLNSSSDSIYSICNHRTDVHSPMLKKH